MANDGDVLKTLQIASWRGIRFPVTRRSHGFQHETAPHKIIFRNGVATEMLGEQGRIWDYEVPLRDSIVVARAGFKNLFSETLRKLYNAIRDQTPGELVDPAHGKVTATPGSWNDDLDAMKRDGVDAKLTFTEYTALGETVQDSPPTLEQLYNETVALDSAVAVAPWPVQQPAPEPTTDPLSLVAGLINKVNTNRDRINASIMSVHDRALKVERAAENAGGKNAPDPVSAALFDNMRRSARHLRLSAYRAANAPPRDKAAVVVQDTIKTPMTLMQLAAQSGLSLTEFLRLNPGLVRAPLVMAGVDIKRPRANQ